MSICKRNSNDSFRSNDPFFNSFFRTAPSADLDGGRRTLFVRRTVPNSSIAVSKRMTAPAKPKQMSPFGLELKFSPGPRRLLKLKNIQKRPEQRFWYTRWTLKRGLIEIWMRTLKLSLSNQTRLEFKQIQALRVPAVIMKERLQFINLKVPTFLKKSFLHGNTQHILCCISKSWTDELRYLIGKRCSRRIHKS